jgi:hypothetical protein
MAARTPRRTFATPLVITLAACSSPQTTTPPHHNPPAPQPEPGNNPPPTTDPATPAQTTEMRWHVTRMGANCAAHVDVNCPKPEAGKPTHTCNPPPPIKYTCPEGLADKSSLEIVRYAGAAECVVVPEPVKCPPNAACNPPRPRPVICPEP